MKERPIIMDAESVRAILDGRKTQTRRVVRRDLYFIGGAGQEDHPCSWVWEDVDGVCWSLPCDCCESSRYDPCPHGDVGDRLWVRETWRPVWESIHYARGLAHIGIDYRAGGSKIVSCGAARSFWPITKIPDRRIDGSARWRSPLHMPRWASRITLEITGVRVERLQEITIDDAIAEGCPDHLRLMAERDPSTSADSALDWFADRWDRLNAKLGHPWESNPWVWVLEFRRVEP